MNQQKMNGLIIKMNDDWDFKKTEQFLKNELGTEWEISRLGEILPDILAKPSKADGSPADYWDLKYKLLRNQSVDRVEPDFACSIEEPHPKDNEFNTQATDWNWALNRIAWHMVADVGLPPGGKRYGEGIYIAQFDSGYTKHPEIWPAHEGDRRLRPELGYDFISKDKDPRDQTIKAFSGSPVPNGHGTGAASVLISSFEGSLIGAAHRSFLVPYRVTDYPWFHLAPIVSAVDYAIRQGNISVITMSIGSRRRPLSWYQAFQRSEQKGILSVAAAGQFEPLVGFLTPANFPNVVACTGSTKDNCPWWLATDDIGCDISAPAENVGHASPGTKNLAFGSGTTFSTAFVASAAATWLAHWGRNNLVKHFGAHNMVKAFMYILKKYGYWRPDGKWEVHRYGVGILHMANLVRINPFKISINQINSFYKKQAKVLRNSPQSIFSNVLGLSSDATTDLLTPIADINQMSWDGYYRGIGDELAYHLETHSDKTGAFKTLRNSAQRSDFLMDTISPQASSTLRAYISTNQRT